MIADEDARIGPVSLRRPNGGITAEPLCPPRQRPHVRFTIEEDSLPDEKSVKRLEPASPSLPPIVESEKGEGCDRKSCLKPPPHLGLQSNGTAAEKKAKAVRRVTLSAECLDEPEHPVRARSESILVRIMNHYRRNERKTTQDSKSLHASHWCDLHPIITLSAG